MEEHNQVMLAAKQNDHVQLQSSGPRHMFRTEAVASLKEERHDDPVSRAKILWDNDEVRKDDQADYEGDVIMSKEKQDVHLPASHFEDEGVSFKKSVKDQIRTSGSDVILDEEEVDVHLPVTEFEEEGVSFKNEDKEVEDEEEVEAHLPNDDELNDSGVSFQNEDHQGIQR